MNYVTSMTYLTCQTCQAKIHCEECGKRLEETLQSLDGIRRIKIDLANQRLEADSSLSVDDFAELLEEHGIFSDL